MASSRFLSALILIFSTIAFAQQQPQPKPADNQPPPPRDRPQQPPPNQPPNPQNPQRQGFGFGFRDFRPDVFVETVAALADLSLQPDFTITPEQKESIATLRADTKMAMDKWRGENHDELQKLADDAQAARESGNQEKARDLFQQRRNFMNKGPRPEDAVKKLMNLLNEEQRKRLDEKVAERRAEAEAQRQQGGFGR